MLDGGVGEYDVETRIAEIECVAVSVSPEKRRIPLGELASIIDAMPRSVQ